MAGAAKAIDRLTSSSMSQHGLTQFSMVSIINFIQFSSLLFLDFWSKWYKSFYKIVAKIQNYFWYQIESGDGTWFKTVSFNTSWNFCIFIYSLLHSLINWNAPKGLLMNQFAPQIHLHKNIYKYKDIPLPDCPSMHSKLTNTLKSLSYHRQKHQGIINEWTIKTRFYLKLPAQKHGSGTKWQDLENTKM